MPQLVDGQRTWSLSIDEEGNREYSITHRVRANRLDGPYLVSHTPGLPQPGAFWAFDNDVDPFAFCKPTKQIKPVVENEPNIDWDVTSTFSTKAGEKCQDQEIEDPLLEPPKLSGTFIKYTEEATKGRSDHPTEPNKPFKSSSHELFRGPQVEFDANRPTVRIEQNVPQLQLALFSQMVDTVNDAPLWGLPPRCVKLSNVTWEEKFYGTCNIYYTRIFDFDINFNTFDRDLQDEGTKALHGRWEVIPESPGWKLIDIGGVPPDKNNPTHFTRFQDRNGNISRVLLNGNGEPIEDDEDPATIHIEKYEESNMLLLDIPATIGP